MHIILSSLWLAVILIMVCYCDIKYNTIFNWIIVPTLAAGITIHTTFNGFEGFLTSILGAVTGFLLLIVPFVMHWICGGDLKLITAAGAILGPLSILYATLLGLIFFGIAGLIYLTFNKTLEYFLIQIKSILLSMDFKGINDIEISGTLPLGVFLCIGILAAWIYTIF